MVPSFRKKSVLEKEFPASVIANLLMTMIYEMNAAVFDANKLDLSVSFFLVGKVLKDLKGSLHLFYE